MNKICASLITYYPDIPLLRNNINTFLPFVDKVYIIDNTPDNNNYLDEITNFNPKISLLKNNENLGIANALNIAINLAQKENYQWLLTMDQDSAFYDFAFYLECFNKLPDKHKIALTSTNIDYKEMQHFCHVEKKSKVITSGSMLNLTLVEDIGYFNERLFIDEVDFDYCLEAKILGYATIMFTHIPLQHTVGTQKPVHKKIITEHNARRVYYMTRNRLYMASKYRKIFPEEYNYYKIFKEAIYTKLKYILKYETAKWAKIKALFLGIKHFLQNKYGALNE